jgi:outer membrane biosynthesis protein TonB
MRKSFYISIIFHLSILAAMVIQMPFSSQRDFDIPELMSVEVISELPKIEETIPPKIEAKLKEKKPVIEETKPGPVEEFIENKPGPIEEVAKTIDEPKVQELAPDAAEPETIPLPTPKKPEIVKKVAPQEKPKQVEKTVHRIVPQAKPQRKPPPKPEVKTKKSEFDEMMDSVLNSDEKPKVAPKPQQGNAKVLSLEDADRQRISRQIQPCWIMQEVADVEIEIGVEIASNGKFSSPRIKNMSSLSTNPVSRTLAEGAVRAISDERCNDVSWLKSKYKTLTSLTIIFNPRDMLGW